MSNLIVSLAHSLRASTLTANSHPGVAQGAARDRLYRLRQWLNHYPIRNAAQAHLICRLIPVQCPFARDIYCGGHLLVRIPPLCKLNPLYAEVVGLRFRALCYLADECGEDVRCYC